MFVCIIYADICAYELFVNDTHYRKWEPMYLQVILEAQRTSLTWPFHSTQLWPSTPTVRPPAVEIRFHIQTVRSNRVWGHGLTHQVEQLAHLLSKWPGFKSVLPFVVLSSCSLSRSCPVKVKTKESQSIWRRRLFQRDCGVEFKDRLSDRGWTEVTHHVKPVLIQM